MKKYDVIIVGGGPAGATAAIYLTRGGATVALLYKDLGALSKASLVSNYYAAANKPGIDIASAGLTQAQNLGCDITNGEVTSIEYDGTFVVTTGEYTATSSYLVLATGATRALPKIEGLKEFEGRGVSFCATCDGNFFKKKPIAILGSGDYALHEAQYLSPLVSSISILTNNHHTESELAKFISLPNTTVYTDPVVKVAGTTSLESIELKNGKTIASSGLFVAYGSANASSIARQLGLASSNNHIQIDSNCLTSLESLYACGDCTGGIYQISKASYEGMVAGQHILSKLNKNKPR